jgi:hypothetical protein
MHPRAGTKKALPSDDSAQLCTLATGRDGAKADGYAKNIARIHGLDVSTLTHGFSSSAPYGTTSYRLTQNRRTPAVRHADARVAGVTYRWHDLLRR